MISAISSEGKELISAGRASKRTGYSEDYIGQLCRSKKISGKLVGRSWYVDLNSLLEHKNSRKDKKREGSEEIIFSYAKDDLPLFPILSNNKERIANKKARAFSPMREITIIFLFFLLATGTNFALFNNTGSLSRAEDLKYVVKAIFSLDIYQGLLSSAPDAVDHSFPHWHEKLASWPGKIQKIMNSRMEYHAEVRELEDQVRELKAIIKGEEFKPINNAY